ncbi:hypothetical protein ACWC5I_00050 [Kitasatospora sp. NPDC001574]
MGIHKIVENILAGHDAAQAEWENDIRRNIKTYDPECEEQPCEDSEMEFYTQLREDWNADKAADLDVYISELRCWLAAEERKAARNV